MQTGDATRERILEAALELFAAHGFAGTSTRQLGARAEVNVATLNYHFGGKQGVYDAVVVRLYEDLQREIPAVLDPSLPRPERLERVMRGLWAFARGHRTHIKLLVRHTLDHDALPEVVSGQWTPGLLLAADAFVGEYRPEWSSGRRRVFALTTMHAVARLAITDEAWLARAVGDDVIDALVADVRLSLGV
jgi:AcrR family transcriptional regulator